MRLSPQGQIFKVKPTLLTGRPTIIGKELYYISQAVNSGWLQGDGEFSKRCHHWLEKNLKCHKALLTHSCTAALEMASILIDITPGDEVIMPSFTFPSTANAVVLRGGVPVFVDIHPETLNIDERAIEDAITPKTRAIYVVHYAGVPCRIELICEIARRHSLFVIEDAAQAILTRHKGRFLGTWGHFGCLSFHESKNIISGEGGALLINDPAFVERAEIIREKGTNRSNFLRGKASKYAWVDIGSSYLPSELVAAFLYAQLENAKLIIRRRIAIARRYHIGLKELHQAGHITLPDYKTLILGNAHIVYLLTSNSSIRDKLIDYLLTKGIVAASHYIPLHSAPAGIRFGRAPHPLPVTDDISGRLLRLPIYYELSNTDIDHVISNIKSYFSSTAAV